MMAERPVVSRQPHHLRALPRACETEGRGALLGHSMAAQMEQANESNENGS